MRKFIIICVLLFTCLFGCKTVQMGAKDVNLLRHLSSDLHDPDIWVRVSNTRFECRPLNLAVDVIDNNRYRLSGIKDNDEIIVSSEWGDISYEITRRTLNWDLIYLMHH